MIQVMEIARCKAVCLVNKIADCIVVISGFVGGSDFAKIAKQFQTGEFNSTFDQSPLIRCILIFSFLFSFG